MQPAPVRAVFYVGQKATTMFDGSERQYEANRTRNDIAVRKLNGTPFYNTLLIDMPTLEEFDATVAGA